MALFDAERMREHGKRFANGFTAGQKTMSIIGVVVVLGGAFFFTKWAATADYAALYTGLDPADAGEVTTELDARGVDYKLSDGGRTIMVPRPDVYQTRLDLSSQGLPSGGDSYALIDEEGITTSEFRQRIDYQRALQGELSKTIMALDGVKSATVNLTIPKQDVFVGADESKTSAAVLVETAGGSLLSSEQVQSIVHLVSSSVADLPPDQVTVTDSLGNLLAAPGREVNGSSEQLEERTAFEDDLSAEIESLVAASLGPGHAAVSVTADLDFDKSMTEKLTYTQPGGNQTPQSQSNTNETYTSEGSGSTGGVVGPDGSATGGGGTVDYNKTETQAQYAVNSVAEEVQRAPGSINRLNVAMIVDQESIDAGDIATWTQTISAAAGIDTTRGDIIKIQRTPFDDTVAKQAEKDLAAAASADGKDFMMTIVRYVVTLLIVGIVLFLAWRSVKKSQSFAPMRVPLDLRELEADLARIGGSRELVAVAAAASLPDAPIQAIEPAKSVIEAQITDLIERQPDEVAQTLRSWLADRRA